MKFITERETRKAHIIESFACKAYEIDILALRSKSRDERVAHVRFIVWRALNCLSRLGPQAIAERYQRDRTTVNHGLEKVRDDKDLLEEYMYFVKRYKRYVAGEKDEDNL